MSHVYCLRWLRFHICPRRGGGDFADGVQLGESFPEKKVILSSWLESAFSPTLVKSTYSTALIKPIAFYSTVLVFRP